MAAAARELRPFDYMKLFRASTIPRPLVHATSFLEMCLVINKVRPAALVTLDPSKIEEIRTILRTVNVGVYHKHTQNYIVIDHAYPVSSGEKLRHVLENPANHVKLGELIGYLTAVNISTKRTHGHKEWAAQISVRVEYGGMTIPVIQLVPQIVVDKTDREIAEYYAPMIRVLERLNTVLDPREIQISTVSMEVRPFKQPESTTSTPRCMNCTPKKSARRRTRRRTNKV